MLRTSGKGDPTGGDGNGDSGPIGTGGICIPNSLLPLILPGAVRLRALCIRGVGTPRWEDKEEVCRLLADDFGEAVPPLFLTCRVVFLGCCCLALPPLEVDNELVLVTLLLASAIHALVLVHVTVPLPRLLVL